MLEVLPRSRKKVLNLQEKVELLNMYYRLRSAAAVACHFTINEFSIRTIIIKKKICEAIIPPVSAVSMKTLLLFVKYFFILC